MGTIKVACTGGAGMGGFSSGPVRLVVRLLLSWCLCLAASFAQAAPAVLTIVPSDSPVLGGDAFHLTVTYDTVPLVLNMSPIDVAANGGQDTLGEVQSPGFQADVFEIV